MSQEYKEQQFRQLPLEGMDPYLPARPLRFAVSSGLVEKGVRTWHYMGYTPGEPTPEEIIIEAQNGGVLHIKGPVPELKIERNFRSI